MKTKRFDPKVFISCTEIIIKMHSYIYTLIFTYIVCTCIYNILNIDLFSSCYYLNCSGIHLRENMKRGVYVDGLIDQVVSTAAEANEVSVVI